MKKIFQKKETLLFIFLAFYGFSVGLFDNYRELWMSANGLSTSSISHVISIAYIVTILCLFFFTIKVSVRKLKYGITISLLLKMMLGTILICLNDTDSSYLIKFFMFFDIAFSQLILSSIYPFIMNLSKGDIIYTKKEVIESLFNKLGFLFVSIILGKSIFSIVIDYNICLLLSTIFVFLAFMIFILIEVNNKKDEQKLNLSQLLTYFSQNKIYTFYLFVNLLSSTVWGIVLGMPMILLINKFNLSSTVASFLILGLGIISNILAMIIVKYFRFKNDHINLFFKIGMRVILYLLTFLTGNYLIFFITIIYLLLTDSTHNFVFSSYFVNKIDEKYSLFLVVLKYCSSLLGKSIGLFICGIFFDLSLRLFMLPVVIISIIHYFFASVLVNKKNNS